MSDVPAGWYQTTLGSLGRYLNGRGFKKSEWRESGLPIIRIQNLTGSSEAFNYYQGETEERYTARPGDLLIPWAATLGAYIWKGPKAVVNQHIFKVESFIDIGFHKYLLDYKLEELKRRAHGSGMIHVTRGVFDALPVTIPESLEQQREIVDFIEDQFSRLDAATQYTRAASRRLQIRRLSANDELFFSDTYPRMPLSEALDLSLGGLWGSPEGVDEFDVNVFRVTELRAEGKLDPTTAVPRSVTKAQYQSRALQAGDLLLEKSGGGPKQPVGRVGLVQELSGPSICANFMQLMRPKQDLALPEYLHAYLNAFHERGGTVPLQKASTNIRNLKASEYLKLLIPLPDISTQRGIVDRVANERLVEAHLLAAMSRLTKQDRALRRSILKQAFTGALRSQSA